MRRIVVGCFVIVLAIVSFALDPGDIAGCKGRCWQPATPIASPPALETPVPPDYTPSPEERCAITDESISLLGLAELEAQSSRPLCVLEVPLPAGASSQSITDPGGAEAYTIQAGTVEFRLEASQGSGVVRVVPAETDAPPSSNQLSDGSYQVNSGEQFTISAGAAVFIDYQDARVAIEYTNTSTTEEATILIAAALPAVETAATPQP